MANIDPNQMMGMARKMQDEMRRAEDELAKRMVEGKASNGLVRVIINGALEPQAVKIDPEAIDPDDPELLEDLVLIAVKDGLAKATQMKDEAMEKVTGGMGLGGLGGLLG